MNTIKKKYIVDENNRKVAVQLDIATFDQIEQILEDYALGKLIEENANDDLLDMNEAREHYKSLNKKD